MSIRSIGNKPCFRMLDSPAHGMLSGAVATGGFGEEVGWRGLPSCEFNATATHSGRHSRWRPSGRSGICPSLSSTQGSAPGNFA